MAQTTVICEVCKEKFKASDGNTTNLLHHLKRKHQKEHTNIPIKKSSCECLSNRHAAKENEGFKRLFRIVDTRYELPSHKYFSNVSIPRLYSKCRDKIENKKKAKKTLASFLKTSSAVTVAAKTASPSLNDAMDGELKGYLSIPNADSEIDSLEWWTVHEGNFPRVSQLAKKYLCIPATSAPPERVFSTGGNIVTCQRPTLKPEKKSELSYYFFF
ncbi:ZBED1 protein, partial [Amia calva]|nr:ZBED1 protein [Amia calva]